MKTASWLLTSLAVMAVLAGLTRPPSAGTTPQGQTVRDSFAAAAPAGDVVEDNRLFIDAGGCEALNSSAVSEGGGAPSSCEPPCNCCTVFGYCRGCNTTLVTNVVCIENGELGELYQTQCRWQPTCPPNEPDCELQGPITCPPTFECTVP